MEGVSTFILVGIVLLFSTFGLKGRLVTMLDGGSISGLVLDGFKLAWSNGGQFFFSIIIIIIIING